MPWILVQRAIPATLIFASRQSFQHVASAHSVSIAIKLDEDAFALFRIQYLRNQDLDPAEGA